MNKIGISTPILVSFPAVIPSEWRTFNLCKYDIFPFPSGGFHSARVLQGPPVTFPHRYSLKWCSALSALSHTQSFRTGSHLDVSWPSLGAHQYFCGFSCSSCALSHFLICGPHHSMAPLFHASIPCQFIQHALPGHSPVNSFKCLHSTTLMFCPYTSSLPPSAHLVCRKPDSLPLFFCNDPGPGCPCPPKGKSLILSSYMTSSPRTGDKARGVFKWKGDKRSTRENTENRR
jgi:hypothetical protein